MKQYIQIGHFYNRAKNPEWVWIIDKDFNFYKQKLNNKKVIGHSSWDLFIKKYNNLLAAGRYVEKGHVASNLFRDRYCYSYRGSSYYPVKNNIRMVLHILKEEFNNPKVYNFGWPTS